MGSVYIGVFTDLPEIAKRHNRAIKTIEKTKSKLLAT